MRSLIFAAAVFSILPAASASGDDGSPSAPAPQEATTPAGNPAENGPPNTPPVERELRVQVAIVDVSLTEMQRQKLEFSQFGLRQKGNASSAESRALPMAEPQQLKPEVAKTLLDSLTRQNVLRVVAGQSLVVSSRQPGYFFAPGKTTPKAKPDRAQSVAERKIGTEVHLTVTEISESRVRLDVLANRTEVEPLLSIATRGGIAPGYRTSGLAPTIEVDFGMTAICAGPVQQETVRDRRTRRLVQKQTQTLVLVSPELPRLDSDSVASPPAKPGDSQKQ